MMERLKKDALYWELIRRASTFMNLIFRNKIPRYFGVQRETL
jgi:hypothetical protein